MRRTECEVVRAELDRVLSSGPFATSQRSRQLLSYLVKAELEGRSEQLKGYTIAVEALDQGDDFDPSTNSLVRTQMRQLRERLGAYYENEGASAPVRFQPRKGETRIRIARNTTGRHAAWRALLTLFDGPVAHYPHLFTSRIYRTSVVITVFQLASPLMFVGSMPGYPMVLAALLVSPLAYTLAAVLLSSLFRLFDRGSDPGWVDHVVGGLAIAVPYWGVILLVRWLADWHAASLRDALVALIGAMLASAVAFGTIGYLYQFHRERRRG